MFTTWETTSRSAVLILNLIDAYAQDAVGVFQARPRGSLRFFLEAQTLPQVVVFEPPLEMVMTRSGSGYYLFFGQVYVNRFNDTGVIRANLPGDAYQVRVTSPTGAYQDGLITVPLPMGDLNRVLPSNALADNYTLLLQPGPAYRFDGVPPLRIADTGLACSAANFPGKPGPSVVRGSLHTPTGDPITGAEVSVLNPGQNDLVSVSAAGGDWLLWYLDAPSRRIDLQVVYPAANPGGPRQTVPVSGVCVVRGYETSLGETAVRGTVTQGGRPYGGPLTLSFAPAAAPPAGAPPPVPAAQLPPDQPLTARNGAWLFYFPINQAGGSVDLTLTLPDGQAQTVNALGIRSRQTVLAPVIRFP